MRWLLLKDLQILRRSPLLVVMLIALLASATRDLMRDSTACVLSGFSSL